MPAEALARNPGDGSHREADPLTVPRGSDFPARGDGLGVDVAAGSRASVARLDSGDAAWPKRGLGWAVLVWAAVSALLVVASYRQLAGTGGFWDDRLTLGAEHSLGAWWSGGLLLIAGLLAVACGETVKAAALAEAERKRLARAFRVVGFWLVVLCIDEWASLHERYDWSDIAIPRELRLPPIAVVMAATVFWAAWTVWRQRGRLGAGWSMFLVTAGFGIMGSVYIIELAEHAYEWPAAWQPARLAIEEGQELTGMGVVLFAIAWKWMTMTGGHEARVASLASAARLVGIGLLCVAPLLILLQYLMPLEGKWARMGVPGKVVTPMLLLVAAAVAWFTALRAERLRGVWFVVAAVMLLGSVESMTSMKRWYFDVPINTMRKDFDLIALGTAMLILGTLTRNRAWWVAGLVAAGMNLVGFVAFKNPVMQGVATLGAVVLLFAVVLTVNDRIPRASPAGR